MSLSFPVKQPLTNVILPIQHHSERPPAWPGGCSLSTTIINQISERETKIIQNAGLYFDLKIYYTIFLILDKLIISYIAILFSVTVVC